MCERTRRRQLCFASVASTESRFQVVAVCLGNICRSPIAEAVLRDHFVNAELDDRVQVDSAGTAAYHVGNPADRRSLAALRNNGYDLDHRAQRFTPERFGSAGLVLAMDHSNLTDLRSMLPEASHDRVRLLRSFDPEYSALPESDPRLAVPDPYYGDGSDFEVVLMMIESAAPGVVDFVDDRVR